MGMMKLDKELYRQAYEWYRQWNEVELLERARTAGKLSPQDAWRQYAELWAFCRRLSPQPSELQRRRRLAEWDEYYSRVQRLEAWRQGRRSKT